MGKAEKVAAIAAAVVVVVIICSFLPTAWDDIMPEVEVTLANDGLYPIWYMCQLTDKTSSLYELQPNSTYRFKFPHLAFPMRWCYLYINPRSHGFFWAYTVRSRCTKCFWSINKHPSLYRGDKGRWERQKLFMPADFNLTLYSIIDPETEEKGERPK
ncbi:hypothetical protein CDL12_17064 [Handroanthus impetiginosus]|uniref:S-protein homolog n=1 Tax=Handroanthus impetiginosus TaxID=429701 RepID=A0A2G9GTY5_9LAMI|nr:hypothetical protein CDL12_18686 [Handroanthus impetiginosus]PIN10346.1 hypothetical protein CDL12_17064 [Handroanthus impetiginosus]